MTDTLAVDIYEGTGLRKSPSQMLIQLDRYTVKNLDLSNLKPGDIVVGTIETGKYPAKDFGRVLRVDGDKVTFWGVVRQKEHTVNRRFISLPMDPYWRQTVERMVAGAMAIDSNYTEEPDRKYAEKLYKYLLNEVFVPAGRIQAMLGAKEYFGKDLQLTPYNCFVLPSPKDSRDGIAELLKDMANTLARGGGVGTNLSTLRPRHAKVYGVNGTSSGAVSWGGLFSYLTGLIEQGGSRRGALMLQLHVTHPDIYEFINVKREPGKVENANLSVQITYEFMEAVENDREWHLIFPVTTHPEYDKHWGTKYRDIHEWLEAGLPVQIYETIRARDLFRTIIESAWASAEPGFVVYDRMNIAPMYPTQRLKKGQDGNYYTDVHPHEWERMKLESVKWNNTWNWQRNTATNPCGEQMLPPWGVCNLGHINLAEVVDEKSKDVNWELLRDVIHVAVRFLDNIIDYAYYFDKRNEEVQKQQRRVGLGTMGLHNLLLELGLRYGSDEAVDFTEKLYRFIANEAYRASALLAKDRGAFPMYSEALLEARVPRMLDPDVRELIKAHGLRNSHLLTQAPTGTTGTKTGRHGFSVSTGIEPYFAFQWERKSRVGKMTENVAQYYVEKLGVDELPSYFVSAIGVEADGITPQITPIQHVRMQAAVQKWTDASISKTTNCPSTFTVEQTEELYLAAFRAGLVGITIYRDGSRNDQILSAPSEKKEPEKQATAPAKAEEVAQKPKPKRIFDKRPARLTGVTYKRVTPLGNALITINIHEGQPVEVVLNVGKGGSHTHAMSEALGRMASLFLQYVEGDPIEKLEIMIRHLSDIGGSDSVGFGPNRITSVPDAVGKALKEFRDELLGKTGNGNDAEESEGEIPAFKPLPKKLTKGDICPQCGQASLVKLDGCQKCLPELGGLEDCGYSRC